VVFWNAARSVVLVTEDDDDDSRLVAQRKANYARLVPGRAVPRRRDRAADARPGYGEPVVTARLRFVEYADDINGADVLAGPKTTRRSRRRRCSRRCSPTETGTSPTGSSS